MLTFSCPAGVVEDGVFHRVIGILAVSVDGVGGSNSSTSAGQQPVVGPPDFILTGCRTQILSSRKYLMDSYSINLSTRIRAA